MKINLLPSPAGNRNALRIKERTTRFTLFYRTTLTLVIAAGCAVVALGATSLFHGRRVKVPTPTDLDPSEGPKAIAHDYREPTWTATSSVAVPRQPAGSVQPAALNLPISARESNEVFTTRLERQLEVSGSATGNSTSTAWQALSEWKRQAKDAVTFTDLRCFKMGCSARASYANPTAFTAANKEFEESTSWIGARFHSGPFQTATGAVEATWILYASDPTN